MGFVKTDGRKERLFWGLVQEPDDCRRNLRDSGSGRLSGWFLRYGSFYQRDTPVDSCSW
jgi:hypothetical protein